MNASRERPSLLASLLLVACHAGASPAAPDVTPNPIYQGGPVVSNAQVVMVNWGDGVPAPVQSGMPGFYSDIVHSDYWGVLEEYSTPAVGGTGQQIRFGSFLQSTTITPSHCATAGTACTLTEGQVQAELASQITNGHLPAPTVDAAGQPNTVYMVHFDPKVTITLAAGGDSCQQYCAANTTFAYGSLSVGAGIVPDQTSASACRAGCGGSTDFEAETLNSMAILGNVVTDPQVGFNNVAWYDANYGEITYICPASSGATATVPANGNSYTVYPIWSKRLGACTSTGYLFRNGFE